MNSVRTLSRSLTRHVEREEHRQRPLDFRLIARLLGYTRPYAAQRNWLLVTVVLVRHSPQDIALLPGLWQVFFSLGVFASARLLPRPIFAIGGFYLCAGVTVLILSRGAVSLEPWCMGVPFGVGQLVSAAILYWTLERRG